jgi:hypothetical protein
MRNQYNYRPASGKEGQFRLQLGGDDPVTIKIRATDILPIPEMEHYEIAGQFKPGTQIALQKNSACSGWFDLADLVALQDLEVTGPEGEDAHDNFLDAVADSQAILSNSGLSWRWMLAAAEGGSSLELHLQGLALNGNALQSTPALCKDNVATVLLAKFPVQVECFDGRKAAGPVPIFFSSNPIETAKELEDNVALAHAYIQALAAKILIPEEITSLEALAYVQSPRGGKGEAPFVREWRPESQPAKRAEASPNHQPIILDG